MSAEPHLPSDPGVVDRTVVDAGGVAGSEPALPSERGAPNGLPAAARNEVPHASAAPHAAPHAAPSAAGSRADRIRQATARGLLGGHVPAAYEDEDWETVKSANPFEVLYLDHAQPGAMSAAVLDDRRQTFAAFWKQKDDVRNRNAGGQRDRIDRKYGFDVGKYAGLVERAYVRLAGPGALAREAQAIDDARRRDGERQLRPLVRSCLADGLLTIEETETLLQEGEAAGLTREETADYVSRVLADQRFTEREPRHGTTLSAVVLSTEWISAERRAREAVVAARAAERAREEAERTRTRDITPLKFRHGAARTLDELLDLCDQYPDEAAGYLADGILEPWLAGAAGEAEAASTAKRVRSTNPNMRRHALELFARALGGPLGRPTAPVLTAHPPECVFGTLPQGARRSQRVEFARAGRPFVWGTTRIEPELPGIRVSRTFQDDATGRPPSIEITVDTVNNPAGDYATTVVVEPAGGAPIGVPLRFSVVPLALTVDRPAIDFGTIPVGQTRTVAVHVGVSPGGRLAGLVSLGEARGGVTLDGAVREDGGDARLTVDSRLTGPGVRYRSELRFETNAGVVRVPVSFRVRGAGTEAGIWAGSLAAVGGVGMWVARHLLVPGDVWHLAFAGRSHGTSVVAAGAIVSVLGFAARRVLRTLLRLFRHT